MYVYFIKIIYFVIYDKMYHYLLNIDNFCYCNYNYETELHNCNIKMRENLFIYLSIERVCSADARNFIYLFINDI